MKWAGIALLMLLPSCGVILPYAYDARDVEERLSVAMSKEEVSKILGKPAHVLPHDDQTTVWEYWRYPKGEWVGYLLHCPFHPYCYLPAEPRDPYYVALRQDRVCLWGTPDMVRTLIERVCTEDLPSRRAYQPRPAIAMIPVFMPLPITVPLQRLAVLREGAENNPGLSAWLDLALNSLRFRHPSMTYVEREDLRSVLNEVAIQYSGRVDDATMVKVGKLTGADSLLTYRTAVSDHNDPLIVSLELRLMAVETGTTLFRQTTTASIRPTALRSPYSEELQQSLQQLALEKAAAYGLAALAAAFGDNSLGIVPDLASSQKGITLLGLLEGSPAARAGLSEDDRILEINHRPVVDWTETLYVPARLIVDRHGQKMEIVVGG